MREAYVKTLLDIAEKDPDVYLLSGDLGFGMFKHFWERFPDRFINVGIAEQNMMSVAAGMALERKTVFAYSIGSFPTFRCLEQIRNDCAYHEAAVKVVCGGGGLSYGPLGMSHHATEDLAVMRALPGITVMAPGDQMEAAAATRAIWKRPGTCYLRLGRGGERRIHSDPLGDDLRKAIRVLEGRSVVAFCTGDIFGETSDACELLKKQGITPALFTFPMIKPIDQETIMRCAEGFKLIVTVEEHNVVGGFGSAVAEVIAEMGGRRAKLVRIGLQDTYCTVVGSQKCQRTEYGISAEQIASKVMKALHG